jgi:CRISPR-associated protein Cmr2
MSQLFVCSIGPVQDFIASARRSRDLWYGSWLLSEISKATAKAIVEAGGQLIFPVPTSPVDLEPKSKLNAPNKVVGVLSGDPASTAKAVNAAIRTRIHQLRNDAFKKLSSEPLFDRRLAEAQIDDLVEFFWVSVAFDSDSGYAAARELAETLLNARKTSRNFVQPQGDYKPKSSLDGARESIIDERAFAVPNASDAEKERKGKALFDRFGARPAERLSGVDLLKRLGERSGEPDFPSTSHMAALPFLEHVDRHPKAGSSSHLLAKIKQLLEDQQVTVDEADGALVFSSRLAEWVPDKTRRKTIAEALEKLLKNYADDTRPQPYYALLVADGDNMGAAIDHLTTQEGHRRLSLALSTFAQGVGPVVRTHDGVLVYSGGDDVMAYLPLHGVLQCAEDLAVQFARAMSKFTTAKGISPTLSTGIVVAHHLEPLSDALDLARQAEKAAKSVDGKDALAITVSKRSGVDRTIKCRRVDLAARLEKLIEWRRQGAISAGVAYELQELDRVLGQSNMPEDALIGETLRIIDRKRESGGQKDVDEKQVIEKLEEWIKKDKIKLQELAHELIVASMFAGARDMAEGEFAKETSLT